MKYLEKFPIPGVAKLANAETFTPSAVIVQWCHEGPSLILHSSAAAPNLPFFAGFSILNFLLPFHVRYIGLIALVTSFHS